MKNYLIISLLIVVTSCSSLKVTYDYDKQADFAKYKTYAFSEDAKNLKMNQLNRDRILNAIETQMAAKGFTKSDNPDALVDVHVRAEQKMDATATTTPTYGYGGPWRYGYGGGFSTTQINYNEYVEGTLFVNLVDKASEKIVWQGRATKTIDEDASAEKREKNINTAVQQIFSKYPPSGK
jgi:hypothetical protein